MSLHYIMLVICVVIFIAVFGVMFYSILKHRKSVGTSRPTSTRAWRSRSPGPWCRSSS
jgi:heme/copper-type cytochrome/quinol oxidase subunit 2